MLLGMDSLSGGGGNEDIEDGHDDDSLSGGPMGLPLNKLVGEDRHRERNRPFQ